MRRGLVELGLDGRASVTTARSSRLAPSINHVPAHALGL
jgi:hypothetical protein